VIKSTPKNTLIHKVISLYYLLIPSTSSPSNRRHLRPSCTPRPPSTLGLSSLSPRRHRSLAGASSKYHPSVQEPTLYLDLLHAAHGHGVNCRPWRALRWPPATKNPSMTSGEISTPQIIAPNTPPPNHQVILFDSMKISEDSIPAELTTAHIDALS
jgi:hypothetical protein